MLSIVFFQRSIGNRLSASMLAINILELNLLTSLANENESDLFIHSQF